MAFYSGIGRSSGFYGDPSSWYGSWLNAMQSEDNPAPVGAGMPTPYDLSKQPPSMPLPPAGRSYWEHIPQQPLMNQPAVSPQDLWQQLLKYYQQQNQMSPADWYQLYNRGTIFG